MAIGRPAHPCRAEVNAAIAEETRKQPSAHWVDRAAGGGRHSLRADLTVDQAFADPQVEAPAAWRRR